MLAKVVRKVRGKFRKESSTELIPSLELDLQCGNAEITRALWLSAHNLLVLTTPKGRIFTFKIDSAAGKNLHPKQKFQKHDAWVNDIAYITDAIVATVDKEGNVKTWNAATGADISEHNINGVEFYSIERLSASKLVAGTRAGEIVIFSHDKGKNISVVDKINAHTGEYPFVWDLAVFGEFFYSLCRESKKSGQGEITVWSRHNMKKIATLNIDKRLSRVEVNEYFIVVGTYESTIHVFENKDRFKRVATIDLKQFVNSDPDWLHMITFISPKLIMGCTTEGGTFFISLESFKCAGHLPPETGNRCRVSFVVGDGRICVAGEKGYGVLINPPKTLRKAVQEYAERLKVPVLRLLPYSNPVKEALLAVNNDWISIDDAVELAACPDYVRTSMGEWRSAHSIVMKSVKEGLVPADRKFKGEEIYWFVNLYKHGALFTTGKGDRNMIFKIIKEAEAAGLIGAGTAETIEVRAELLTLKSRLEMFIGDLYCRVIATDERVLELLNYQNMQKKLALISALFALIPCVGGNLTNILSGGAVLMEGLETGGFVESILGASKGFVDITTEPVVTRFFQTSSKVLKEEHWKVVPFEEKRNITLAARDLNLSLDALQERLDQLVCAPTLCPQNSEIIHGEKKPQLMIKPVEYNNIEDSTDKEIEISEILSSSENDEYDANGLLRKENAELRACHAIQEEEIAVLQAQNVVQEQKIITLASENARQKQEIIILKSGNAFSAAQVDNETNQCHRECQLKDFISR